MDIAYLLWLQQLRETTSHFFTPLLEGISSFAVFYILFIPVFIYWGVDKRKGLYTLCSFIIAVWMTNLLKLVVCVYRPWVRDARILPAGNAIATATGYSFPSGHCATAASVYGGLVVPDSRHKTSRGWIITAVLLILLTGFSRNYLGVHTPQDVVVGLLLGGVALLLVYKLFQYIEKYPQREKWFLLAGFVLGVLSFIYIRYKSYPLDYIGTQLVVDPQKIMTDGYRACSALCAFCFSRYVEKRWIGFEPAGLSVKGILWTLAGFVPFYFLLKIPFGHWCGPQWGAAAQQATAIFYTVALYPWALKYLCPHKKTN